MAVPTPVTTALALVLGCLSLIGGNVTLANTSLDLSKVELHQTNQDSSAADVSPAPHSAPSPNAQGSAQSTTSPQASGAPSVPASTSASSTASAPASAAQTNLNPTVPAASMNAAQSSAHTYEGSLVRERPRYRDPFGNRITAPLTAAHPPKEELSGSSYGVSHNGQEPAQINFPKIDLAHSKVAVIYFSVSELLDSKDVDELTGASVIYNHKHERRGITEYVADLIAQATNAQTYLIARLSPYSHEHDEIIYQASLELDERTHPEIVILPPLDLKAYDVIFIGYPIWWYELPMPVYSFFERYDLSGKVVIPFCTHGGSRAYKTFALIAQQEPNAYVLYNDGLIIDRLVVPTHAPSTVGLWLQAISERLSHKLTTPVGIDLDRNSPILKHNATNAEAAPAATNQAAATPAAATPAQALPAPPSSRRASQEP